MFLIHIVLVKVLFMTESVRDRVCACESLPGFVGPIALFRGVSAHFNISVYLGQYFEGLT